MALVRAATLNEIVPRLESRSSGKERDSETNLDYFGARYYGSTMGRFLSPDWAAKPTAVPYADLGDPQSLNLYTYVRNRPISNRDLDGHKCDKKGQQCDTLNEAGTEAEKAAYNKKDALKKEFGGTLFKTKGDKYSHSDPKHIPVPGTADKNATAINTADHPKGTSLAGTYHSHSDATPRSNEFSTEDLAGAWTLSGQKNTVIPSFIGDANGGVYKYTPELAKDSPSSDADGRIRGEIVTVVPPANSSTQTPQTPKENE